MWYILRSRSKLGIVLHTAACFYAWAHHGREDVHHVFNYL